MSASVKSMNSMTRMAKDLVMKAIENTSNFDPRELPALIRDVRQSLSDDAPIAMTNSRDVSVAEVAEPKKRGGRKPKASDAPAGNATGVETQAPASEPVGDSDSSAKAPSLSGSVVYDEGTVLWPEASEEKRRHFMLLMEQHNLKRDEQGYPIPNTPDGRIVTETTAFDPFSGDRMQMIKSRLRKSYDLDRDDFLTMFRLPSDYKITAGNYSDQKRAVARKIGLGRVHRKSSSAKPVEAVATEPKRRGRKPGSKSTVKATQAPSATVRATQAPSARAKKADAVAAPKAKATRGRKQKQVEVA